MSTSDGDTQDPLQRLPYEAWLKIILFAIVDSREGPLPFVFISQRWAQTIFEEKELWTTIFIDGSEDEEARIHIFLQFSRNCLLDLIFMQTSEIASIMHALMPHAQRIRSLSIRGSQFYRKRETQKEKEVIQWFTAAAPSYPQMIAFSTGLRGFDFPDRLLTIFPNLQALHGVTVSLAIMLSSKLQEIDRIHLETLEDGLSLIQSQHLRYLEVNYPQSFPLSWVDETSRIEISDKEWVMHAEQLSSSHYGVLEHLRILLRIDRLGIIPHLLPRLPLLRSFHLSLVDAESIPLDWTIPPFLDKDISHITNISIFWSTYRELDPLITETLVGMFTTNHSLRYVEDLDWSIPPKIEPELLYAILHDLDMVKRLTLAVQLVDRDTNVHPKAVLLEQVYFLDVSTSVLEYIEAPNVVCAHLRHNGGVWRNSMPSIYHLIVSPLDFDDINASLPSSLIESRWRGLQILEIDNTHWSKTIIHINSLTTVNFTDRNAAIDALLVDLLRNPEAFPNLHTVRSSVPPMWELLFEVLRDRNRRNIASIKQLTFSAHPVPAILSRLVLLLQGQSDIYTERDIDDTIYEYFTGIRSFTPYNTICKLCAMFGYSLCNIAERDQTDMDADNGTEDILDLWGGGLGSSYQLCKSEKWENFTNIDEMQRLVIRSVDNDCSRHANPVHITAFMLDGLMVSWHPV